jgi:ABC-type proline/glycine betaine transport system ATPase subunit
MKNGEIIQQGTYSELIASGVNLVSFLEKSENEFNAKKINNHTKASEKQQSSPKSSQ